ncbi:putative membrane protein [Luteibacter sp. UNC138MFCol5.1]|uniref:bestrophin family protein n=1 Tax=Luteibacter sp. UNC138MFCol5.1 TaxID=1502774 RepID=UPI0008B729D9|nr:bestrophin family protein [Luteibacter sp. UNC138MFCol5.1]SEO91281.1 putative membrane protein [Luteibacter sp. UNC138MFCol5.1]
MHRSRTPSVRSLLFAMQGSIIPVIWPRVLYTMLLSAAVVWIDYHVVSMKVGLNAAPLTLMGLTLAIFLGFRNTVAYQRWWEARTLWGELIIAMRNLARQAVTFLPGESVTSRERMAHRLIAFTHALRHHLRGSDAVTEITTWIGDERERAGILAAPNRPAAILSRTGAALGEAMRERHDDPILLAAMDRELGTLSHVLGGCERIHGTPIPYAYILLLHRTVHIYCFLLPFCLVGLMGWFTPLVVGVLAYTFFGLDALGDQIEDPFDLMPNDLPLDAYCKTVERDLLSPLDTPSAGNRAI